MHIHKKKNRTHKIITFLISFILNNLPNPNPIKTDSNKNTFK